MPDFMAIATELCARHGLEMDGDYLVEFEPFAMSIAAALDSAYEGGKLSDRRDCGGLARLRNWWAGRRLRKKFKKMKKGA